MNNTDLNKLHQLITEDARNRENSLNLNASENHTSPSIRQVLAHHPSYDYYEFPPSGGEIVGPWQFKGPPTNEKIVDAISCLCHELLGSPRITVRPKGGQAAEIAVLLGLAGQGDTVFYAQEQDGGHFGLTEMAEKCGITLHPITFDTRTHHIDIESTLHDMGKAWKNNKRKLMIVNQSFILQHQPWALVTKEIKQKYPDIIITCDASHLLGLIIGKQLNNPLEHGVDILHASTHKTFPGPQKAIIVFHENVSQQLQECVEHAVSPLLQSNCGTAEIISLALAFAEMQRFGQPYAQAVCQHARQFATSLTQHLDVTGESFNYTETHQVWIPLQDEDTAWRMFSLLHSVGIRAFPTWLPFVNRWGLRFGAAALTRRGLTTEDFEDIAMWIGQLLTKQSSAETIGHKVRELTIRYSLSNLKFTFNADTKQPKSQPICA